MNILIIGGSRFVGPYLIQLLLNHKHTITVFNRGTLNTEYPKGVTFIKGDRDKGFHIKEKFDAVIDMCAYTCVQTRRALYELHFDYFLNFGTNASYQKTELFPVTEDSPIGDWPAFGAYNKGKVECEKELENSAIPHATIRPTYILGPKNFLDREHFIYSRIKKGIPLILPGNGLGLTQFVFVDEVASAIVVLVEKKATGAFNIAGDQIISPFGLTIEMGRIIGKKPIIRFNPDAVGLHYKEEEFPFDNENLIVTNDKIKTLGVAFTRLLVGLRRDYNKYYKENT